MKKITVQLFSASGDTVYQNVSAWGVYGDRIWFVVPDDTRRITYSSTLKYLVIEDENPVPQT